ncbi:Ubiquitin-60S ribosomal protein L40 [Balamuthia mandrillaris]
MAGAEEQVPIPLNELLAGEQGATEQLRLRFEARGWAFVSLPQELLAQVEDCMRHAAAWLSSQPQSLKASYHTAPRYGYVAVPALKEAIRVLTGPLLPAGRHQGELALPPDLKPPLLQACRSLDRLMADLILKIGSSVFFRGEAEEKGEGEEDVDYSNVPLLWPRVATAAGKNDNNNSDNRMCSGTGMVDIALYDNHHHRSKEKNQVDYQVLTAEEEKEKESILVAAHFDPGLVALSLRSTAPGLQMLANPSSPSSSSTHQPQRSPDVTHDEAEQQEEKWPKPDPATARWIDVPASSSIGVLWCGSTAAEMTNGRVQPGWHRVVVPSVLEDAEHEATKRMTMWYEACAMDQIPPQVRKRGFFQPSPEEEQERREHASGSQTITVLAKMLTGKKVPLHVDSKATVEKLKEELQYKEGIPPDKMRLIFAGRALGDPNKTLEEYGIFDGCIVHSVLALR